MRFKQLFRFESQHLSKSILLEESGAAMITKAIVGFSLLVFVVFLAWSFVTTIDEVAIARGEVLPVGKIRTVQSLSGGLVQEIWVEEGQVVEQGQPLLLLANPEMQAQYKQLTAKKHYLAATQSRLKNYLVAIGALKAMPPSDVAQDIPDEPKDRQFIQDQKQVLELLLTYHKTRRAAFQNQMEGYKVKMEEITENTNSLKELAQINEELLLVNSQLSLVQEKIAAMTLRSPIPGAVQGLNVNGIGTLVAPGSTLLKVVPLESQMFAQVKISAKDIGHVKLGQQVHIKFTTYDYSRHGGLVGHLDQISATSFIDRSGTTYYKASVFFDQMHLHQSAQALPILPGMTVEADIITGEKTVFEYLLKPVFASSQKALRER